MSSSPRHVALAIVFSPKTQRILMVTSRKHPNMRLLQLSLIDSFAYSYYIFRVAPHTPFAVFEHIRFLAVPKGGIEKGESSLQAAVRESWEEAGTPKDIYGGDAEALITINLDPTSPKKKSALWFVHALEVDEAEVDPNAEWLESKERRREWVSPAQCLERVRAWYSESGIQEEISVDSTIEDTAERLKGSKRERKGGAMELALRTFLDTLKGQEGSS